jgi:hypothetical protein
VTPTAFGAGTLLTPDKHLNEPMVIDLPADWTLTNTPVGQVRVSTGNSIPPR